MLCAMLSLTEGQGTSWRAAQVCDCICSLMHGMHTNGSAFFLCFLRAPPSASSARACAAPSARSAFASKAEMLEPPPRGKAASSSTTSAAATGAARFGAMLLQCDATNHTIMF